jgi:RNA polymerase sigma factor (sigma-70 family)
VNSLTDQQLLRDYAAHQSDAAFAELVRRHVDLVYSAALRMVCDAHLAEDVAQGAFVALAQNARSLAERPVLSGWLHRTAQNLAANAVRSEVRRRAREQEAAAMNQLLANESDADWEIIAPHLDAALGELNDADRDALLLRYFERKSAREMAEILGTSEDAAQKRVSRAVEHLREFFSKQKIAVGASGLVVLISANAVQSAPIGLAATISAAAVLAGTAVHTSALIATTKTIVMTTLQKTIVTATLVIVAGAGIFEAHQAVQLREQNQILQQQQTPLAGQIRQLQSALNDATNQLAGLLAENAQLKSHSNENELLKLRGKIGVMQNQLAAQPAAPTNSDSANGFAATLISAAGQMAKAKEAEKLNRLKAALNLSDYQTKAISDLMDKNLDQTFQTASNMFSGNLSADQSAKTKEENKTELDAQIKALLTPDQSAAFDQFNQAETADAADASAKQQLAGIMTIDGMELTQDQQDQIRTAFGQAALQPDTSTTANLPATGNIADAAKQQLEQQLAQHVQLLQGILTPDQLNLYQQHEQAGIEQLPVLLKMFSPQKPAGTSN